LKPTAHTLFVTPPGPLAIKPKAFIGSFPTGLKILSRHGCWPQ